jgi:tRNA threonylcarbamoyladenosine biosynthesis protein TsaE
LALAERIGQNLKGGEVIELASDLGGGKTTFVRGLARGINSNDQVSSPTFTLSNVYAGSQFTLHHFDFYRLAEPGIMREELQEILEDANNVTVIEWAEIVHNVLPSERLTIHIKATGELSRHYTLVTPKNRAYMIEGLS